MTLGPPAALGAAPAFFTMLALLLSALARTQGLGPAWAGAGGAGGAQASTGAAGAARCGQRAGGRCPAAQMGTLSAHTWARAGLALVRPAAGVAFPCLTLDIGQLFTLRSLDLCRGSQALQASWTPRNAVRAGARLAPCVSPW